MSLYQQLALFLLLEKEWYLLRDVSWQVKEEDDHYRELDVDRIFICVVTSPLSTQTFNKIIKQAQS